MDWKLLLFVVALALIGGASSQPKSPIEGLKYVGGVNFTDTSPAGIKRKAQELIRKVKDAIARNDDTVIVLKKGARKINIKLKGTQKRYRELKAKFANSTIVGSIVLDPLVNKKRNARNIMNFFENLDLSSAKTLIIIENDRVVKKRSG